MARRLRIRGGGRFECLKYFTCAQNVAKETNNTQRRLSSYGSTFCNKFITVVFLSILVTLQFAPQILGAGGTFQNYGFSTTIGRSTTKEIDAPQQPLFHLVHTTNEHSFNEHNMKGLESIFFHHPNAHVKLYVKELSTRPVQPLIQAGYNITLHPIELKRTFDRLVSILPPSQLNTASVKDFVDKIPRYSQHPFWYANLSDLLRLAFLYLEGGVYLDTDVILVHPLFPTPATATTCDYLPYDNVVAWEDPVHFLINGAIMKFKMGHPFLLKCLQGFFNDFNIGIWAHNGPKLLTRVWEAQIKKMTSDTSQSLGLVQSSQTVGGVGDSGCERRNHSDPEWVQFPQLPDVATLEPRSFYPVHYAVMVSQCMNRVGNVPGQIEEISHGSFAVHTNNKISGKATVAEGSLCHWLYNAFCVVSNCSVIMSATSTRT